MSKKKFLLRLVFGILILTAISFTIEKAFGIGIDEVRNWLFSFGPLAPVIYGLLIYTCLVIPFNPISEYALVILASYIFPPHISILSSFIADIFVLITNYYLAKIIGRKILIKLLNQKDYDQTISLAKKINLPLIFSLRFIPSTTAVGIEVVSYAAALANIPFLKFFIWSIIPWTILSITFFTSSKFLQGYHPLLVFLPVLLLALVPILVVYLQRKKLF